MLERFIQAIRTDNPGLEEPAATRERLKGGFAPGAVRRMTQLGLLVGAAASPTLFQTSIHPSSVQQVLIGRQRSVREFFPLAGGPYLAGQALLVALLATTPRVIVCGGEERGTWMAECGVASTRAFAFALALTAVPGAGALGRLTLSPIDRTGGLSLADWFDLLHFRRPFAGPAAPGWQLKLEWS